MNIALKIGLLLIGVGFAGWLAVIAYDVNTDYRRFAKLVERRPEVKRQRTDSPRRTASAERATAERPKELV